jgi:hypothetical protein
MSRTVVVNRRREMFDVYIGRGSVFGNPFSHLRTKMIGVIPVGSRAEAIRRHREWLLESSKDPSKIRVQTHVLRSLGQLRGKILGCYCAPLPCHGDLLAALADRPKLVEAWLAGEIVRADVYLGLEADASKWI